MELRLDLKKTKVFLWPVLWPFYGILWLIANFNINSDMWSGARFLLVVGGYVCFVVFACLRMGWAVLIVLWATPSLVWYCHMKYEETQENDC